MFLFPYIIFIVELFLLSTQNKIKLSVFHTMEKHVFSS